MQLTLSLDPGARHVVAGGTELVLLPQRAIYSPEHRTLFIADVHLGKAEQFQSLGVPVPSGANLTTLERLSRILHAMRPVRVLVLGDLLHGRAAQAASNIDALAAWRAAHRHTQVTLVRGNHDDRSGDPPLRCGIDVVAQPYALGSLLLCHEPRVSPGAYVLAGHLHPAYRLNGRLDSVRLPCFWVRPQYAVLPAFGEFTGGWRVAPEPGDELYITDEERVFRVPL